MFPLRSVEDREEIFLAHDEVLFAVDLDFGSAVLAEQHAVAGLDVEGDDLAVLVALTGADGDHLGLDRLFLRRVGDEQATRGLGLFFETLDENAVVQWTDLHGATYRHRARRWQPLEGSANKDMLNPAKSA